MSISIIEGKYGKADELANLLSDIKKPALVINTTGERLHSINQNNVSQLDIEAQGKLSVEEVAELLNGDSIVKKYEVIALYSNFELEESEEVVNLCRSFNHLHFIVTVQNDQKEQIEIYNVHLEKDDFS